MFKPIHDRALIDSTGATENLLEIVADDPDQIIAIVNPMSKTDIDKLSESDMKILGGENMRKSLKQLTSDQLRAIRPRTSHVNIALKWVVKQEMVKQQQDALIEEERVREEERQRLINRTPFEKEMDAQAETRRREKYFRVRERQHEQWLARVRRHYREQWLEKQARKKGR